MYLVNNQLFEGTPRGKQMAILYAKKLSLFVEKCTVIEVKVK